jgi:hypothetical protein
METIAQNIGQLSLLLIGRSEEEIMKFLFNQNNNNWRRRNGYPMKRKGLNKRKKRKENFFMVDESYLLFDENKEFIYSTLKRMRKLNGTVNDDLKVLECGVTGTGMTRGLNYDLVR